MNEASVNIPVPAFWWADVAFLSGVYLSVPTSSDRLLQRELEGQPQSRHMHAHICTRAPTFSYSCHPWHHLPFSFLPL